MLRELIRAAQEAERAGAWDQALAQYEAALAGLTSEPKDGADRASVLRWIGTVYRERGELELARGVYEESLAVAEEHGLLEHTARALIGLAAVEQLQGRLDTAEDYYLRAGKLARQADAGDAVAVVHQNLGILANIRGDIPGALANYALALDGYRALGNDRSASQVLNNLGMSYVDLAQWVAAERVYGEAADLAGVAGDAYMVGVVEVNRAELFIRRQRFELARESCDRAVQVFTGLRSRSWAGEAYKLYGMLYRDTGNPEQASSHFALALGLAEASQNRLLEAESQREWALLRVEEARFQDAVLYLNRALEIFRQLQARREVVDIERRLKRLTDQYVPAVRAWGAAMGEARDRFKAGCTQRIADHAVRLGERLDLSGDDLAIVRVGALVHEVGNTAVPAEVLGKPRALTARERELVQVHTIAGDSLVEQLGFSAGVREVVRGHHERWDGAGYPDRIRGEAIPVAARIVGIASVYDALVSPRAYRPAYSRADALRLMERESGGALDPGLFGVFRTLV